MKPPSDPGSSRFSTPLLVTCASPTPTSSSHSSSKPRNSSIRVLQDSNAIMKWADETYATDAGYIASSSSKNNNIIFPFEREKRTSTNPLLRALKLNDNADDDDERIGTTLYHDRQRVEELNKIFEKLGHFTRRLTYHHLLAREDADPALFLETAAANVGKNSLQFKLFQLFQSPITQYLIRGTGAKDAEKAHTQARKRIDELFDLADEICCNNSNSSSNSSSSSNGGSKGGGRASDYLVGGKFSAADITFATAAAPLLFVQPWEGYGAYVPQIEFLPDSLRDLVKQYRSHPSGQRALRMFRRHRGERQIPCNPPLPNQEPPHGILGGSDERGGGPGAGGGIGPGVV